MLEGMIQSLLKISTPKKFEKGEYVFYENQTGKEMYIVLQGKVGIYIDSLVDDSVFVADVAPGGFFGEMAIFDEEPRSASAVAMEQSLCIAITKNNLDSLIEQCPAIAKNILVSLSQRIRSLNDQIYKIKKEETEFTLIPFQLPNFHRTYRILEPYNPAPYIESVKAVCPVCGQSILKEYVKFASLELKSTDRDLRNHYFGFDVSWHTVDECPECGYANYNNEFLRKVKAPLNIVKKMVEEENEYYKRQFIPMSHIDDIMYRYYKAIHINQCFNRKNSLLLGKLWLNLYWLYQEAGDEVMIAYSRKQALEYYKETYDSVSSFLTSVGNKQRCAALIGELSYIEGDLEVSKYYFNEVMKYPGDTLKELVYDRIYELRKK